MQEVGTFDNQIGQGAGVYDVKGKSESNHRARKRSIDAVKRLGLIQKTRNQRGVAVMMDCRPKEYPAKGRS